MVFCLAAVRWLRRGRLDEHAAATTDAVETLLSDCGGGRNQSVERK